MSSISQIINHINEADFHKAFQALDELRVQNPQLASLKKEFISGKYGYDFADRFLTFVSNLGEKQTTEKTPTHQTIVNQYGDKSVYIEKNEGEIRIS